MPTKLPPKFFIHTKYFCFSNFDHPHLAIVIMTTIMIMIIIMTRVLIIIIGKLVDEDVIIDIIININIIISIITIIKIIMILREASAWEAGRRLPPRL